MSLQQNLFQHPYFFFKSAFVAFLACYIMGCSPTNTLTMSVKEPAPVQLPLSMNRVGVIDRSMSEDKDQPLEKIDQILSVEGVNLDKDGAQASTTGLQLELEKNDRFHEVKKLEGEKLGNPAFGVFPSPVTWEKIAEMCSEHQLDGLFSLEFYDTDTQIDYSTEKVNLEGPLGLEVPALEHHVTVNTTIKTGWRIYDNNSRNIIDEYIITEQFTTVGEGVNPAKAVAAVTGRKEAVQQISNHIGQAYALSVIPYWTRVKREYYVKGNDQFKKAKRRAQTGNWDGAAEIWRDETKNRDSKIAGRAHYNMAIINEINGEIDRAIEWARKSYEDFNDKLALRYLNILKHRKARIQTLDRQEELSNL